MVKVVQYSYMFAEIILSRRFPKSLGVFDYAVPEELLMSIRVGQLVTIPFRSSVREGVVIRLKKTAITGKIIKSIVSIFDIEPILTEKQLMLAEWMSLYYFVSLGTVIKMMLPEIPKRPATLKQIIWPIYEAPDGASIQKSPSHVSGANLVWYQAENHRSAWYKNFFSHLDGRALVITPEIASLEEFKTFIPEQCRARTVFIHSGQTSGESYDAWKKIKTGQAQLIIATKIAVFLPFHKLAHIVIDHEEDDDHKQYDQNPRYDVRKVAEKMRQLFGTSIHFVTPAPTVSVYSLASQGVCNIIGLSGPPMPPMEVVDMNDEHSKRNFSLISDVLSDAISKTFEQKKNVFLFLNRRGSAHAVICKDCGTLVTCPNCHHPLAVHSATSGTQLLCHHCSTHHELLRCGNCGSVNFSFHGAGTERLEREVRKMFPQILVSRVDSDMGFQEPAAPLVIGTELALRHLVLREFGLVAVISADTLFTLPDYRSAEHTYAKLCEIIAVSSPTSRFIVQTFSPQHPAISSVQKHDPDIFYTQEIRGRKELGYPPFLGLIKIIREHTDKHILDEDAAKVLNALQKLSTAYHLAPFIPKRGKKFRTYIVLKLPLSSSQTDIQHILEKIPDSWIIDRDPVSLL